MVFDHNPGLHGGGHLKNLHESLLESMSRSNVLCKVECHNMAIGGCYITTKLIGGIAEKVSWIDNKTFEQVQLILWYKKWICM